MNNETYWIFAIGIFILLPYIIKKIANWHFQELDKKIEEIRVNVSKVTTQVESIESMVRNFYEDNAWKRALKNTPSDHFDFGVYDPYTEKLVDEENEGENDRSHLKKSSSIFR